ncbi:protein regulator of cytokinesis 1-like [Conger conger]|uniref:protein regulator of cytokinesis 1-like n=1 Tax=Conger conger TaxID=82655 RepID=UPI002A5AF450|nr:protein regulator of cytokinesis 1-like [Conger conger]
MATTALLNEILEEENLRKSLRSSIEKSRKELDTLCRELQLSPFKEDSGTMLQVDKDLRVRVEALIKQKSQRMQELKDLREQDQDLCDILCTDSFSLIPDAHTVPSLQQLQHFRQHLASLAAEKERRRSVFVGLKKQIILCMEDLEQLPDTSFERDVVHEDEDAFCLSEENIASLRLLLSTLEKRKAETAERCGVCRSRIRELWDRLELCQEERDALHQHMASSKKRNLEALQAELSRLEEMKLGRIRDLIKGIRLEIASYWDLCFLSAEEQQAFIPYCSDDFTEELLAVHRAELQQLKQRYEAHRELFDSVRGWEDSWKLFLELEKKATDPSRFNNRGGNLLKEEKQRTDLLKSLTKLEKKLKVQMEAWTEQEGQEFLVRGHNFLQFVEAHWEHHRTEKEREKLERHLKKSRQTEEDMLYGTVKRTPSTTHSKTSSSASAVRLKAELERAELQAQASALKQKRLLDEQEAKLRAEREELQIQTALAASDAKLKVLDEYESLRASSKVTKGDGMSSYLEKEQEHLESQAHKQAMPTPYAAAMVKTEPASSNNHSAPASAKKTEQESLQQESTQAIMDFLVKQQNLTTLPPQQIPIFKGDPMEYRLFIRAFEHGVEDKTDSSKDRLYFMEQYTDGQPRELIRSCLHIEPERGYREAKKLLKVHFGNGYKISMVYIDKALNWPTIKSDDGEALHSFGLYLIGCLNAMADVEYMEELDCVSNMRAIVAKLPYRQRERWRSKAYALLEKEQRSAKFSDLAEFVNLQAKEALHPLFSNLTDRNRSQAKAHKDEKSTRKSGAQRSFTTAATAVKNPAEMKAKAKGDTLCFLEPLSLLPK